MSEKYKVWLESVTSVYLGGIISFQHILGQVSLLSLLCFMLLDN